jgi:hypothetical protein
VRLNAVARLDDQGLLATIAQEDPSPGVRMTAQKRLTGPQELADVALKSHDWVVRKLAVTKLADPNVLAQVATSDPDDDVRREALSHLVDDELLVRVATSAPMARARDQAVAFITDEKLLADLALGSGDRAVRLAAIREVAEKEVLSRCASQAGDPELRDEAFRRMAQLEGQAVDPRNTLVRQILLDPAVVKYYGGLDLDCKIWMEEKRYVKEDAPASYPAPKGKVLMEHVSITIRRGSEVLFKKTYLGIKGRKLESFPPELAVVEGYHVKIHSADVDYLEIAQALLKPLPKEELTQAGRSENKYVNTAATTMTNP